MFFGNGGSAADAQHIAAEFVGRFVPDRLPLAGSRSDHRQLRSHAGIVDIPIVIPSTSTARIQECHINIGHILCEIVETLLFAEASTSYPLGEIAAIGSSKVVD